MRTILFVLCSFLAITLFAGNEPVDKTRQAKEWLKNQPLSFIENKGQFTDSDGKPADNVLFKASYGDCDIYITTEGISYVFHKYETNPVKSIDTNSFRRMPGEKAIENKAVSYYRLDMNLQGSAINKTQIIKELPGKQGVTNYFYPHCPDGIYGVQEFGKITIKNIYKGIDWVIYTNAENKEAPLKYDFLVQPQANYKDIKIKFINAQSTCLADNGTKLKIQTIAGNIEEGNLYSYQQNSTEKQAIKTSYIANADSTFEFEIGAYDKTKPLVIDPLVWATYYGGGDLDYLYSICTDSEDNIYVTGGTNYTNFPILPMSGAYIQPVNPGTGGVVLLKFNKQCIRLWATYYGGDFQDYATSICTDSKDNVYITGRTESSDFPIQLPPSGGFCQVNNAGRADAFLLKFNKQGVRQWATLYGGGQNDYGTSICSDSQDNIFVTGVSFSYDLPTVQSAGAYFQPINNGGYQDVFILKFDPQCALTWASFYGGYFGDLSSSIAVDSQDNIYITGQTSSYDFPTKEFPGAYYKDISGGEINIFLLKFNNQGVCLWATYYGAWVARANSICIDSNDNVYLTGAAQGDCTTLSMTGAYNQSTNAGTINTLIIKFNNLGVLKWATFYGGNYIDEGFAISSDKKNNIYITGRSFSNDLPTKKITGEYWQETNGGSSDAFLLKFNTFGEIQWSTYYGGISLDEGLDIGVDSKNDIYFIGKASDNNNPTIDYGNGAYYDESWNGDWDGFILKINSCINQKTTSVKSDRNNICINDNGDITLTAIGGIGDTLKWYTDNLGLNYFGKNSPLIIPSPTLTTTYYARWESLCDTSVFDSVSVIIYTQITKNINPVICQGDTFTVGASKYTKTGTYTDLLTSLSGCDSTVITNLAVNPQKQTTQSPVICEGDLFTVGTNSYSNPGTYTDHFKTSLGCDSTVVTNLLVNPTKRTPITHSICQGESFIVGTKVYTTAGTYSDTLSSVLFCDSIVTTNLTVHPVYHLATFPNVCPSITVTVGSHIYNTSGTYIDKLSSIFGCDSIITTNLTVYPVEQNIQSPEKCTGESITVGVNTYTETGTYTDVLTSSHNCDSTIFTHLTINPTVLNPITKSICEGEIFTVGANEYSTTGNYIDVLKTSLGCDSTVTTILTVNPVPLVSLGDDQLLCPGDSILLTPGNGFRSYLWSDGSVLNNLKVTTTGNYSVTAYNEWCPASDEITIDECGTELWFPNAFSPDSDGINDRFKPVILGTLNTYQIIIYNRWGQELFESLDAFTGWDGIFQGSLCATGQYVYIVTYSIGTEPATQKQGVKRGSFTLLR